MPSTIVNGLLAVTRTGRVAPAELNIHLVLDNYATHKAPPVKAWLARHPRYHLHFTPTSTSWLNQVGRWLALLADKQSKRGVHRSMHDLKAAIAAIIRDTSDMYTYAVWIRQSFTGPVA